MKKIIITESQLKKLTESIVPNGRHRSFGKYETVEKVFSIPIQQTFEDIDVTLIAKYEYEDQGIGAYEFQGQPGHQSEMVYNIVSIEPLEGTYNPDYLQIINNWINNNYDDVENEFIKKLEKE